MKRTLMAVVCLFGLAMASTASAAVINGQFVPDSLVGTNVKYRLVFVTSGATEGKSSDIGVYNAFLKGQVAGTMLDDSTGIYGWQAIMSTSMTSTAATQINLGKPVEPDGYVGIFNTVGASVAANEASLLSTTGSVPIGYDQNGTVSVKHVWTGSTNAGGYPPPGSTSEGYGMGSPTGNSNVGLSGTVPSVSDNSGHKWLNVGYIPNGNIPGSLGMLAGVYGISGELTAIPEPSTIALWSICAGVAGLAVWRKRRKNS